MYIHETNSYILPENGTKYDIIAGNPNKTKVSKCDGEIKLKSPDSLHTHIEHFCFQPNSFLTMGGNRCHMFIGFFVHLKAINSGCTSAKLTRRELSE